MIDFALAQKRCLELAPRLSAERVSLESAVGRTLASSVSTHGPLPAFTASMMDGYGFLWSEETTRTVQFEVRAGGPKAFGELGPSDACRIFTGAPVPPEVDTVVMQENVVRVGDSLSITKMPKKGANLRRVGDDLAPGATALLAGTRLGAHHLPLLAACQVLYPEVVRKPRLVIVSTGDELLSPGSLPEAGKVFETASLAIAALARQEGCDVSVFPLAADNLPSLVGVLGEALGQADMLVTIGGVSVGDYDLVKEALARNGVSLDFWRVAIKPGKPLAVGKRGATVVVGLPGNPVSAYVTFLLFALPMIRALSGRKTDHVFARARLSQAVAHVAGRLEFLRVTLAEHPATTEQETSPQLTSRSRELLATPIASQSSNSLTSLAHGEALALLERDRDNYDAFELVDVLVMP